MSELDRERKIITNNATGPYREGIVSVATSDAFITGFRSIREKALQRTEEERKQAFIDLQRKLLTSETVMNLVLPYGPGLIEAQDRDQASELHRNNVYELQIHGPQTDMIDRAQEG